MSRSALSFVALLVGAAAAHAHTGIGDTQGFAHGFAHPALGIDHVLVMLAVGSSRRSSAVAPCGWCRCPLSR